MLFALVFATTFFGPAKVMLTVELGVKFIPVTRSDFPGEMLNGRKVTFGEPTGAKPAEYALENPKKINEQAKTHSVEIIRALRIVCLDWECKNVFI